MRKLITILAITLLCSFKTDKQERWVLVGTVNDFTILKTALMKDTVSNKELINWIDTKLQRLRTQ